MRSRGGVLILVMLGLAAIATVGSLWYRRHETWRTLELWGPEAAQTIVSAEQIEALRLAPASGREADLTADGQRFRIVARRDMTTVHAREPLTLDSSFQWQDDGSASDACRPTWTYALQFRRGDRVATVLLSFDCPRAMLVGGKRQIGIKPIAKELKLLLDQP